LRRRVEEGGKNVFSLFWRIRERGEGDGTTWIQRGLRGHPKLTPEGIGLDMPWPQAAECNMITNKQTLVSCIRVLIKLKSSVRH